LIEHPYWWDTVPPGPDGASQFETPAGRAARPPAFPSSVDVLVIGAGYTGLSAGRRLALSGASVLVVDAGAVGSGASSRNGGQVLTGLRVEPTRLVKTYGAIRARELFDAAMLALEHLEALIAQERIACDYGSVGHIQAAWKPAHFRAFRDEQELLARVFDHHVRVVDRSDQRAEIGSDAYYGLLVDDRSGALNPARYVAGLAAAAAKHGAKVFGGIRVERVDRHSAAWTVRTSAGDVSARDVLVATNGYTGAVTQEIRRRLVPVGSYVVATEPLSALQAAALLPRRRMAFDSKHFLYYFRVTGDHRLLFGGRAELTTPNEQSVRRAADILRRGIATVFPDLARVPIAYAWGGNVAFARDEMPHAGAIGGLHFAGGYAGHGIALATELGDVIGQRIAGAAVDHPLLGIECPTIPFYRGNPWFLPLAGTYYKVLDWMS
jgi:glycine/D-amino acid oxidase-like deaminating enzyme